MGNTMAKTEEQQPEQKEPGVVEGYSNCGCHKAELINGVITVTQVNEKCAHGLGDTPVVVPKGAAKDVGLLLIGLGA